MKKTKIFISMLLAIAMIVIYSPGKTMAKEYDSIYKVFEASHRGKEITLHGYTETKDGQIFGYIESTEKQENMLYEDPDTYGVFFTDDSGKKYFINGVNEMQPMFTFLYTLYSRFSSEKISYTIKAYEMLGTNNTPSLEYNSKAPQLEFISWELDKNTPQLKPTKATFSKEMVINRKSDFTFWEDNTGFISDKIDFEPYMNKKVIIEGYKLDGYKGFLNYVTSIKEIVPGTTPPVISPPAVPAIPVNAKSVYVIGPLIQSADKYYVSVGANKYYVNADISKLTPYIKKNVKVSGYRYPNNLALIYMTSIEQVAIVTPVPAQPAGTENVGLYGKVSLVKGRYILTQGAGKYTLKGNSATLKQYTGKYAKVSGYRYKNKKTVVYINTIQ